MQINLRRDSQSALGDLAENTVAELFDDFVRNEDPFDTTCDGFFARLKLKVEIKCQDPWYNAGGLSITDNGRNNYFKCMNADLLYFVVYQSDPTHPRGKANWDKIIVYKVIDRNKFERSKRHYFMRGQRHVEKVIIYEWDNLEIVKEITDIELANKFRSLSGSEFLRAAAL
jgi:hypothetical protein